MLRNMSASSKKHVLIGCLNLALSAVIVGFLSESGLADIRGVGEAFESWIVFAGGMFLGQFVSYLNRQFF